MDGDMRSMLSWSLLGCIIGMISTFTAGQLEIPYSALGVFSAEVALGTTLVIYGLYRLRRKSLFVIGLWIVLMISAACALQHFGLFALLSGSGTHGMMLGLLTGVSAAIIAAIALVRQFIEYDD